MEDRKFTIKMEYEMILGDHFHMTSYFLRHLLNIPILKPVVQSAVGCTSRETEGCTPKLDTAWT